MKDCTEKQGEKGKSDRDIYDQWLGLGSEKWKGKKKLRWLITGIPFFASTADRDRGMKAVHLFAPQPQWLPGDMTTSCLPPWDSVPDFVSGFTTSALVSQKTRLKCTSAIQK